MDQPVLHFHKHHAVASQEGNLTIVRTCKDTRPGLSKFYRKARSFTSLSDVVSGAHGENAALVLSKPLKRVREEEEEIDIPEAIRHRSCSTHQDADQEIGYHRRKSTDSERTTARRRFLDYKDLSKIKMVVAKRSLSDTSLEQKMVALDLATSCR